MSTVGRKRKRQGRNRGIIHSPREWGREQGARRNKGSR